MLLQMYSSFLRSSRNAATHRLFGPSQPSKTLVSSVSVIGRGFSSLKSSYDYVKVEKPVESVGLIRLDRPEALNALCDALFDDLIHAGKALDADSSIGCIVVTGSEKAFAAGADIAEMKDRSFDYAYSKNMFAEWQEFTRLSKPVIAAVNGFALGGGCELAMMCDFILAGDKAKFGQPEINLGVIPGAGGTQRLTRAMGKSKSMYYCLTADHWNAEQAEQSGLVAKVFPAKDLVDESVRIAAKIASKGRISSMMAKEAVNASQELSLSEGLRLERRLFHALFSTHDQKEGMSAFLEKRSPDFKHK